MGGALAESSQAFATLFDEIGDRFDTLQPEYYNRLNLEFLKCNMNIRTLVYLGFTRPLDDFTTITYTTGAPNETIYGEHGVAQNFFSIVRSGVLILQDAQPRWQGADYDRSSPLRLLNRLVIQGYANDVFRRPTLLDDFNRWVSENFYASLYFSLLKLLPAWWMFMWTVVSVVRVDLITSVSLFKIKTSAHSFFTDDSLAPRQSAT